MYLAGLAHSHGHERPLALAAATSSGGEHLQRLHGRSGAHSVRTGWLVVAAAAAAEELLVVLDCFCFHSVIISSLLPK